MQTETPTQFRRASCRSVSSVGRTPGLLVSIDYFCVLILLILGVGTRAGGLPEPSLVLYGIIAGAQGDRQTNGVLQLNVTRADGTSPLQFQANITNINDQYSYVLFIPAESELPGFPVTATDLLRLTTTSSTFQLTAITGDGNPLYFSAAPQQTLTLASADRGRFFRRDLSLSPVSAYDTNGLLKSWEIQYFGSLGIDPNADPDGDGASNLNEMLAGTNPLNAASVFRFTAITPAIAGGIQVSWWSEPGKTYRVFRSSTLLSGFVDLGPVVPSTPPVSTYLDATATGTGPYFYVIRLATP